MREKLIKLLIQHDKDVLAYFERNMLQMYKLKISSINVLADHLIKNGVVIPVRCGDCEHYNSDEGYCKLHTDTYREWERMDVDLGSNGFCSEGKPKESEE